MKQTKLWISNNGRIACVKHGGGYLEAAIRANPRKSTHVTPLDHWQRAKVADRVAWMRAGLGVMKCEGCDDDRACPNCKEDRETVCRCGWVPGEPLDLDECADCGGSTAPGTPDPHECVPASATK